MRQIVETRRFRTERNAIQPNIERWDQIMVGAMWALSRVPEQVGSHTAHPDIYAMPTLEWPGARPLLIYYRFNDEQVTLLSVVLAEIID